MNCKKAKRLISKYFDQQTDSEINSILFEHIDKCKSCKEEFDIMNKIYNQFNEKQSIILNPYFNQKLKTYIFNKQTKFFSNQIFRSAGIFFTLATIMFVLSFSLIKTIPEKFNTINVLQKVHFNNNSIDEDNVMFGLIELAQEISNEDYISEEE